jgi:hypothetical protein
LGDPHKGDVGQFLFRHCIQTAAGEHLYRQQITKRGAEPMQDLTRFTTPVVVFWLGVAAVIVASMILGLLRRREVERTIRLAIEKGQALDPATVEALRGHLRDSRQDTFSRLLIAGIVTLSAGGGLALMGWIMSKQAPDLLYRLLGAGAMLGCVSLGQIVAAFAVRWLGNRP